MNRSITLDGRGVESLPRSTARAAERQMDEDKAMLRAAADLTRELNTPRASVYWPDMLISALVGYGALAGAILSPLPGLAVLFGLIAALALYRAGSFIHELSHLKQGTLRGFRPAWNLLVGIPMLAPSFMYEGVHNLHHARTRYGTAEDPEYLPLALMKPWSVPLFVLAAVFVPVALLVRYAVLAPLSLVVPGLRRIVVERYSSLSINSAFRRPLPEGAARRQWLWLEAGASAWAIGVIAAVALGKLPLRVFLIWLAVASLMMVLNQIRTLVAHLWENDGEPMSVTAQYLDSVNVPPPALLPALWAPVGLRYHALHHLLPGLPYHALGEDHRRITAALDTQSVYHQASYRGLPPLFFRLVQSTMKLR